MQRYYITTPIYYVNDVPHIGHAYTTLAADVLARFHRLNGADVMFLTGTDEHGQKVEKSARDHNIHPKEYTDKVSESFRELNKLLNISNDDFIRTSEQRHIDGSIALWNKLVENGHIYLDNYKGWYSVRDEAFYQESELREDGTAPTGAPVEWVEEPSYFFNLSKWQDKLLAFYNENPDFILPLYRRNEVIKFVEGGLNDLSISRTSFKWGIPIPGNPSHVMYVWLDALANYITALGYPNCKNDFADYWPANLHIVGKDILRFHAIYWPAFLMAADIELPKRIFAHGWWTNEGEKISKSLGNTIDPVALINDYGQDYCRYYLMREVIFGNDGNFSKQSFVNIINSELANKVGNLVQRTLSIIHKNFGGEIPHVIDINDIYSKYELLNLAASIHEISIKHINNQEINQVLDKIIDLAEEANNFITVNAPWSLIKSDIKQTQEILYVLCEAIRHLGLYLLPFIPNTAKEMLLLLDYDEEKHNFKFIGKDGALKAGTKIPDLKILFHRLET